MKIVDLRTGKVEQGEVVKLAWDFTIGHEKVVITLDTGFQVELSTKELDKIRPQETP